MKIGHNLKNMVIQAFNITIYIFSLLGIIGLFVNFQEIMNPDLNLFEKIVVSIIIFSIIYICVLVLTAFVYWIFINKVKVFTNGTNHSIYLCYGDIFSYKKKIKRNIVIPVNRCFDVIVNNTLISEKSIHGQFLKKLYQQNYSEETINNKIKKELKECSPETLDKQNKKEGNLGRYDSGTIVTLTIDNINYFLFGECYLDKNLKAQTSIDEYVSNIFKLMKYCNNHSQGNPVILPLIGGGFARLGIDSSDILHILIDTLITNKKDFVSDFYIMVNDDIPITKFKR